MKAGAEMKLLQSLRSQASDRPLYGPPSDHRLLEDRFNVITLPHGVKDERESWARRVWIRELNGYDEGFLSHIIASGNFYLHDIITELLDRVVSIPIEVGEKPSSLITGSTSDDTTLAGVKRKERMIAEMTIGDRVAILLHLRKISFGNVAQLETRCLACQESIASDLDISELVKHAQVQPEVEYYNIKFEEYSVWARLPCGRDQGSIVQVEDHASDATTSNLDHARQIVKMCVTRSIPDLPEDLPNDLVQKISTKLEVLDPLANISLNMICPFCSHSFKMPFFVEHFLFQEIMMRQQQLEQEIHWLAFYYHWNENEILSLPITRRKRYVELIADELSPSEEGT
jgi:hypothetical protein